MFHDRTTISMARKAMLAVRAHDTYGCNMRKILIALDLNWNKILYIDFVDDAINPSRTVRIRAVEISWSMPMFAMDASSWKSNIDILHLCSYAIMTIYNFEPAMYTWLILTITVQYIYIYIYRTLCSLHVSSARVDVFDLFTTMKFW